MGKNSGIEWTNHTFNPWSGCTKVSAGCKFCYAETLANRFQDRFGQWGDLGARRPASEKYWRQPAKWDREAAKEGRVATVFCASMADVFEDRPEVAHLRARLFRTIYSTPNLMWLLLTKRPGNIVPLSFEALDGRPMPKNVMLGTSAEDQPSADERILLLLQAAAHFEALTFLSAEPLIGPVVLSKYGLGEVPGEQGRCMALPNVEEPDDWKYYLQKCHSLDWVIAGGESGPNARVIRPDWVRGLRDQCRQAQVPFFFKQWGEWGPGDYAPLSDEMLKLGKARTGRYLDNYIWDQRPDFKQIMGF